MAYFSAYVIDAAIDSKRRATAPARDEGRRDLKRPPRGQDQVRCHDADILAAVAAGDRDRAIGLLIPAYGDALYNFIVQMVGCRSQADDVYQNMWVQVHRDLDRFSGRGGGNVRAWLYTIARNRCLDTLRSHRRRQKRVSAADDVPDAADWRPGAEESMQARQLVDRVERCLGKLRPEIRMLLTLRYWESMTYREIAEVSGVKPAAVEKRIIRALPALRTCVEARGEP